MGSCSVMYRGVVMLMALCGAVKAMASDDLNQRASLRLGDQFYLEAIQDDPAEPAALPKAFGEKGAWWWSVGGGAAFGGRDSDGAYTLHFGLHTFIVDNFELAMEFGPWYFDQTNDDAIAGAFNLMFRWHFIHRERWSVFAEAGAGLMIASDDVPEMGSEFNFMPRAGLGATWQFSESRARLIFGARWQHISNGRLFGNNENPGSDALMGFAGVMIPF